MNLIHVKIAVRTVIFIADLIWIGCILQILWSMPGQHKLVKKYGEKRKMPNATLSRKQRIAITVAMLLVTVAAFLI